MLENFLSDPAAVERRRAGALGPYLDSFIATVSELGYARSTVRERLRVLAELERWLQRKHLAVGALEEQVLKQFLDKRRRQGRLRKGKSRTLHDFLEHLRDKGLVQPPEAMIDESPLTALQKRYKNYLRKERGLSPTTGAKYWAFLQKFLVERFGEEPLRVRELVPDDISGFLLRHARSGNPKVAKLMVTAFRSFCRFLFRYGETECDLAGAIPTVPAWRLAELPRYLEADEVERTIQACDRSTSVGRRDHAVLLLLARLGLRAGEVIALELDDIDWRAGVLTVRGKGRYRRQRPYIYSDAEIEAIVRAAGQLASPRGLKGRTYSTVFGLLSVTGMRVSESLGLDREDVDLKEGILRIRRTKFGKSRLVPLHESTRQVLVTYARARDRVVHQPATAAFFLSERGTRVTEWATRYNFAKVSREVGLRSPVKGCRHGHGPRLHDMRHRFAARTLVEWYRGGVDVERELPKLATYLGHVHVNDTYWYLEAVPELLGLATRRLERQKGG